MIRKLTSWKVILLWFILTIVMIAWYLYTIPGPEQGECEITPIDNFIDLMVIISLLGLFITLLTRIFILVADIIRSEIKR